MRIDELMLLYAAVKKTKVSPVKVMIQQWLMNFRMTDPIECTSLIRRVISSLGILQGKDVPYIATPRTLINEAYLIYGHILTKGPDDSLVFFYLGCTNEI